MLPYKEYKMSINSVVKAIQKINKKQGFWALVSITLLTHTPYILNGFVWLDHIDIEAQNALFPLSQLFQAFNHTYSATHFYRPLIAIMHSLDAAIYGQTAWGYHITNILIHTGVVILLYVVLNRLTRNRSASVIAALIFAVHPLQALSIGAISYRTDPLAAFFTLLAFLFYLKYTEKQKTSTLIGISLSWFCAINAKETAFVWLPALTGTYWIYTHTRPKNTKKNWYAAMAVILPSLLFFLLRAQVLTEVWQFKYPELTFSEALATRLGLIASLTKYLLLPTLPPISDTYPILNFTDFLPYIGLAIIIIGILLFYKYKNKKAVQALTFFTVITILPALNIIPLPRFISPHYLYFTAIAFSMAIATILASSNKHLNSHQNRIYVALFMWLCIATITSITAGMRFQNDYTLFQPESKNDPNFKEGLLYLGNFYVQEKQIDKAEQAYKQIVKNNPKIIAFQDPVAAHINLGNIYLQTGRFTEAENELIKALGLVTKNSRPDIQYNLALVYLAQNKFPQTIDLINSNNLKQTLYPTANLVLAEAYLKNNEKQAAQNTLKEVDAKQLQPPYNAIYFSLLKQAQ